ncbi:hypothetical protein [Paraburkholderia dinghuensis]|uniref:Uncharacterized protein n=1 Tax=Paraburkholderia dinghuensis TaxID=2305225 RepID=A0A3N6N765_9BURK|nr:hypothetical protein [Paraburkholderia dinghuensis]RQH06611.1 hypothetical protein D1Y85_12120 [Paraburkholderia dinghuensis]
MNELAIFGTPDARTLALLKSDTSGIGAALGGGLAGGINRMSIRGKHFRFFKGGTEVGVRREHWLDVVIIAAHPEVGRIWYRTGYSKETEGQRPTCWSRDGVAPDAPMEQIPQVQTNQGWRTVNSCAECPNNIKGSGPQGVGRACAFKKRIVVVSPDDIEGDAWAFDINAMSLFGDPDPANNARSLKDYVTFLATPRSGFEKGIPPHAIITRLTFDDREAVPVVRFGVALNTEQRASFLSPAQISAAALRSRDADVLHLLNVDAQEYAAAVPVEPAADDDLHGEPQPVQQETQQETRFEPPPQEPLGLDHPDVPDALREWAKHPMVTEAMVLDELRANYPHTLDVPKPKAPPPPPPKPVAPPPPPSAAAGAAAGTARRARRTPKDAANDAMGGAPVAPQTAQTTRPRGRPRSGGFVAPAEPVNTARGFTGMNGDAQNDDEGGVQDEPGAESGLGDAFLQGKIESLLNGTDD